MKVCLACEARFDSRVWTCPVCGTEPHRQEGILVFAPGELGTHEGFDERSFEHLPVAEANSFWFRSRNKLIIWALRKYFPQAQNMLEIGCGTGFVLAGVRAALPQIRLVGGELFPAGLSIAKQRVPDALLVQVDARRLPFEAEFDVVGAFDVLEHVDEDERVLAEIHRALRPGGGLLVTVPQHPRLWSRVDEYSRHVRRYTRSGLVRKIEHAGFRVLRCTSFVSILLPLLALSRLRQREVANFDPLGEYRHPAFVDSALACVLAAERTLIRAGLPLPAGGSLIAIAKRR